MVTSKEKIEIALPSKAIHIGHASCPQGCDLMDESLKIGGFPSIRVRIQYKGQDGIANLDPVYGSFENVIDIDIPKGEVVELFCPNCGVSLKQETDICNVCSAPMFVLQLPHRAIIEGCLRVGCFEHTLKIVEAEELLERLFDQHVLDAYL